MGSARFGRLGRSGGIRSTEAKLAKPRRITFISMGEISEPHPLPPFVKKDMTVSSGIGIWTS